MSHFGESIELVKQGTRLFSSNFFRRPILALYLGF